MQNLPGLNENESLVYQTLLRLGPSNIAALITELSLQRSNIYAILKSLAKLGLVVEHRGTKTIFTPQSPELLLGLAEAQVSQSRQQLNALEHLIPDLNDQFRQSSYKPIVKFREGLKGITGQYEELLQDGSQMDSLEDGGDMAAFLGTYATRTFPGKRLELGIFNRVIAPSTNTINESTPASLRETRFINPTQFPFRMDVKITKHLVSLITFQKDAPVGILIENQEIRDNFQILFEYLWNQLDNGSEKPRVASAQPPDRA